MIKEICALCGTNLTRVLLEIYEPDRFERRCGVASEGYLRRWVECSACGAVANVLPVDSHTKLSKMRSSYYEVDFASSDIGEKYKRVMSMPPDESDNWGRVMRVDTFASQWLGSDESQRILDIGAGTGVFLSRFLRYSKRNWSAVAVEPDPTAAAHLRSLGEFEVVESLFTGQDVFRGFKLVTLNKVLEHVEEPVPLLKNVISCLVPERGLLYVELPDKLTIARRKPEDNILGSLHCHLYHPYSLGKLFDLAGFETLALERVVEPSGKITVFGFACLPKRLEQL